MATDKKYAFMVRVHTAYFADQSNPDASKYAFAYTVTISNVGSVAAQLISRHWIITDANNDVQEVKGLGVVGAQPLLQPGQQFEYCRWHLAGFPQRPAAPAGVRVSRRSGGHAYPGHCPGSTCRPV